MGKYSAKFKLQPIVLESLILLKLPHLLLRPPQGPPLGGPFEKLGGLKKKIWRYAPKIFTQSYLGPPTFVNLVTPLIRGYSKYHNAPT